jgi:hypothetical protein
MPLALAAVLVLATALSGCGGDSAESSEPEAQLASDVTVPITAVVTSLVEPGAEPRDVLALRPQAGSIQLLTVTTNSQVFQQVGDNAPDDFSSPELTMRLSSTAEQLDSGIKANLTITGASSPDKTLNDAVALSKGAGAGLTMAPDGSVTALRLTPTSQSENIARSAIELAFYELIYRGVTLPAEPVGVGAVWTTRQEIFSGLALDQTVTATLVSREGDRVVISYDVVQQPQGNELQLSGDAGSLVIDDYQVSGSGTAELDLTQALPIRLSTAVGGQQRYTDGAIPLSQTTTSAIAIEPRA